jgi:isopentenyl-diphosphate delta-isomerase
MVEQTALGPRAAGDARAETDEVVLLDDDGKPIGVTEKVSVHGTETPLHLAFSCHVMNRRGRLLVTRRALSKTTWPGVWTNSFCGHPRPAESVPAAVRRRADHELGLDLSGIELELPSFRYRAVDASGLVENEVCPVFVAWTSQEPRPNGREVMDHAWVDPLDLGRSTRLTPWAFSPWLVLQARLLPLLGGDSPTPASDIGEDVLR